jgi:cystathionine beta-lyase
MDLDLQHVEVEQLRRRLSVKWQLPGAAGRLAAWAAEMDFPIAEPIRAVIAHALQHHDFGYPPPPHVIGLPALFARRMRERYGWLVDESRVELLSDVLQGVCLALLAYTEPGDGALLQTPIYGPFLDTVSSMGRRLLLSPLERDGGRYVANLDHLRRVSEDARILLLCHPHNPTGRVFTRAELDAIAQLALERDWYVVSDEIHADLTFADSQFIPFASLGPEIAATPYPVVRAKRLFSRRILRFDRGDPPRPDR